MSTMVEFLRGEATQASEFESSHTGGNCGLYEGFCEETGCFLKSHIEHQAVSYEQGGRADWTPNKWNSFTQEVSHEAQNGGCADLEGVNHAIDVTSPEFHTIKVPIIPHAERAA